MKTFVRKLVFTSLAAGLALIGPSPFGLAKAQAQKVLFKNFSEVSVTGPIARELSADNHALIIYNSDYQHDGISDLPVTENDAKAVAKLFEGMGYPSSNITTIANNGKQSLEEQVLFFAANLTSESSVVIYYSGHGISFKGDPSNYIVPVDMNPEASAPNAKAKELLFKRRSVNFNEDVLGIIKTAGPKGVVVFYDACRNSPVASSDGTKSVGATSSFVPAKIEGTAMFYSAASGQTSLASLGPQDDVHLSLYTRVLVSLLSENPSIRLSDLHRQVQGEVTTMARKRAAGHAQNPVYENKLDYSNTENKEFCLSSVLVDGRPRCTGPEGLRQAALGGGTGPAIPDGFCQNASIRHELDLVTDLRRLRKERDKYFACTTLRNAIDNRIAKLNWDSTVQANTCEAFQSYLRNFPGSAHATKAKELEQQLCTSLTPSELARHIGICDSTYRSLSFGSKLAQDRLSEANKSCRLASNERPTDFELAFKRAELLFATGNRNNWEQAVELLSAAAVSDYPEAAIRLGDYYSSSDTAFLQRDLGQAVSWYERAVKMPATSAGDRSRTFFRIAGIYNELGRPHFASDAYQEIIRIERTPRDLLAHAKTLQENKSGQTPPDDLYNLIFAKWKEGPVAYQIGEAWEQGAHGVPNVKKAVAWYERSQKLGYGPAQDKLNKNRGGGTGAASDTAYDTLLGCLEKAERSLSPRKRLEGSESCLTSYLGRASMNAPGRADAEEYLREVREELVAYQPKPDPKPVITTPPKPVIQAHPAARFNGKYSGWRGYTDGGRRSPSKECLSRYNFTATVKDGWITFWSDNRTFRGTVSSSGYVKIDRTGLSPRSKTQFSIEGPLNNARMYSGYCGNGVFRLQM